MMSNLATHTPHQTAALAVELVRVATAAGVRLAVAESLTGGLLAAAIVSVPGASRVFSGGVVAYDTELKHSVLGVDADLLSRVGPVDGEVARQMAEGVRVFCATSRPGETAPGGVAPAHIGISTTGVAGPDPDSQTGQAPGTVWVGFASDGGGGAWLLSELEGLSREAVREAAVAAALEQAIRICNEIT